MLVLTDATAVWVGLALLLAGSGVLVALGLVWWREVSRQWHAYQAEGDSYRAKGLAARALAPPTEVAPFDPIAELEAELDDHFRRHTEGYR